MQNYIFVATSLILVYVIYLIRHIVSYFSFLCLKHGLCVNYYINALKSIYLLFSPLKRLIVLYLHHFIKLNISLRSELVMLSQK